jgi:hypothetical protein
MRSVAWRLALATALVAELYLIGSLLWQTGLSGILDVVLKTVAASFLIAILVTLSLMVGLPLYVVFRFLRVTQPLFFALGAALIAAAIYAFPDALPKSGTFSYFGEGHRLVINSERTEYGWRVFWRGLSTYAALGGISGLLFWSLLRWRPSARPVH